MITALLGPTNTGKTHRATQRMLEHESGILALPLRLLAREVYDKVCAVTGPDDVALVTGEEKITPRRPRYWVCTTEAMPTSLEVEFVAVDEIQLAAHEQRGHVFTDRLLHSRGTQETWFMGSLSAQGLVSELVPHAHIETHARLSQLSFAGDCSLGRLPPRSALVAFSMAEVYAMAERLRVRRGGCAVVTGALSPRTRNAQVGLFERGEVDYLVATDAIGMGLNLNIGHVAFASLRKFDGQTVRELELSEISQIAGRAGRHLRDGTFGALLPTRMPLHLAHEVQQHRVQALWSAWYRSSDLEFSSPDALLASLRRPPPHRMLRRVPQAIDEAILTGLLALPAPAQAVARGGAPLELLFRVAQIPDYRKLLLEWHVAFCAGVFDELHTHGVISGQWFEAKSKHLTLPQADADSLVAQLGEVRLFTYLTHQSDWVQDAPKWQAYARDIEDRLSDALHETLMRRFVDASGRRRAFVPVPPAPSSTGLPRPGVAPASHRSAPGSDGPSPHHPFAALRALREQTAPSIAPSSKGVSPAARVLQVFEEGAQELRVSETGALFAGETPLGHIVAGVHPSAPKVVLHESLRASSLGPDVERRAVAFVRGLALRLSGVELPLLTHDAPATRGIAYALERGLGTASALELAPLVALLPADARQSFESQGVHFGQAFVYRGVRGEAFAVRVALARAFFGSSLPALSAGRIWFRGKVPDAAALSVGFPCIGPLCIRVDMVERAILEPTAERAGRLLGCPKELSARVFRALRALSGSEPSASGSAGP